MSGESKEQEENLEGKDMADTFFGDDNKDDKSGDDNKDDKSGDDNKDDNKDDKSGDGKSGDDKEKKDIPKEYKFSLAEDSLLEKADTERIASYALEQGLTQEEADERLSLVEDGARCQNERMQQALKDEHAAWKRLLIEDKEIGGDNLKECAELSSRVVDEFGSKALIDVLEKTGLGNYPEFTRMYSRIGRAMDNDKIVLGGDNINKEKAIEDVFYG